MACSFEHERRLIELGHQFVAGIDEAGRGPLAGPVVAAAVILPGSFDGSGLDDSKKLSPLVRNQLYERLTRDASVTWAVGVRSPEAIDRINILRATHEAMIEAVGGLRVRPDYVLIDGLAVRPFPLPQLAMVGGDGLSHSIAAASVIAKVTRDRMMDEMAGIFPHYGFERHKGYATAEHLAKLRIHGPCSIHRRTFAPVAQLSFSFD